MLRSLYSFFLPDNNNTNNLLLGKKIQKVVLNLF